MRRVDGEHGVPLCERCGGRLRWLGEPRHPDDPSSWTCDPCDRDALVVDHFCRKNGIEPPAWAADLADIYAARHGLADRTESDVMEAWRG